MADAPKDSTPTARRNGEPVTPTTKQTIPLVAVVLAAVLLGRTSSGTHPPSFPIYLTSDFQAMTQTATWISGGITIQVIVVFRENDPEETVDQFYARFDHLLADRKEKYPKDD
jgi:hypothetical protein